MLRALERLIGFGRPALQLSLELEPKPENAETLRLHLIKLGLPSQFDLRLTENRTVYVSFSGTELRVHRGYLDAPPEVLKAIVGFVRPRARRERLESKRALLAWRIPAEARSISETRRGAERTHPADQALARRLAEHHRELNQARFGGELSSVPVRVSRRMKSRLGHYSWRCADGRQPEIVISRRHIRRNGWEEAVHTLLHEMVHQWQDECGLKVDHGREFRRKARAVGIAPRATRVVA